MLGRGILIRAVCIALLAACIAAGAPSVAEAGYGIQPNAQIISVTVDSYGTISPSSIGILVGLDNRDSNYYVWVSESPQIGAYGTPVGASVASCGPYQFSAWSEPGKFHCPVSTILMKPGRTYYWWLDYQRLEDGATFPSDRISGPFSFTLQQSATPAPTASPAPAYEPDAPQSTKTFESAAYLPTAARYDGSRSIKHSKLTSVIYKTMSALGVPRTLAIGCWSDFDYDAVAASADINTSHGDSVVAGFWLRDQPRWLHLAPFVCAEVQQLLDTRRPSATGASSLTTALHETLHAYGVRNEAQTNCFAVQLVPVAAHFIGMTLASGRYLRTLAINITRRQAPNGYWSAARCRDGGAWDLDPDTANLR